MLGGLEVTGDQSLFRSKILDMHMATRMNHVNIVLRENRERDKYYTIFFVPQKLEIA